MKLIISITLLSICSSSLAYRFGTLYNHKGDYVGRDGESYLQSRYSWDYPYASPSGEVFVRRKYYGGATGEAAAPILKYSSRQNADGDYSYEYDTGNAIHAKQTGYNAAGENIVRGSYSYIGPDGVTYTTNYVADRNGYRAYGAHLPTQPEELSEGNRRRVYVAADRDYFETTVRPTFVTISPKSYEHVPIAAVAATRRPIAANSVVILPTPKAYVSPPYNSYVLPSSTVSHIHNDAYYSTTGRPFYSTTGKYYIEAKK